MKILVCEAGKHPAVRDIEHTLKNLQSVVGGYIQALYPYEEMVSVVCNEDGIALNLPLNRIIEGYGIIRGTFFLCGLGEEDFTDLPQELTEKYTEFFRQTYDFVLVGNILMPIPLGD